MAAQVENPIMACHVHQQETDFAPQLVEDPLEVTSTGSIQATPATFSITGRSIQATPGIIERQNPLDHMHGNNHDIDDAPPPYSEFEETPRDAPQIAAAEYSCDNSPQMVVAPQAEFPEVFVRGATVRSERDAYPITPQIAMGSRGPSTPSTALGSPVEESLWPGPLRLRQSSTSSIPRRPVPSQTHHAATTSFPSAKAREAGFEIEEPPSLDRAISSSTSPGITLIPSTTPLKHTRESGKVTAYLIPFPKPRLKGVSPEGIPARFLIYAPPLPPLSKPAPGEKESQWHKTQRLWQEDVRRATMTNASRVTWKGMKAKGTSLINKGVSKSRSSTVEFLDRVSGGAITSTTQDIDDDEALAPAASSTLAQASDPIQELPASSPAAELSTPSTPTTAGTATIDRPPSVSSTGSTPKPNALDSLTLIHPPSLTLTPEETRAEFVNSLMRTREQSRNKALVASALLPFAATMDVILIVTFGGLTQTTGVWAYQNTRGAMASQKMTRGLARSESHTNAAELPVKMEAKGCTCGHHEGEFGCAEQVPKADKKGKSKSKDEGMGITTNIQSSIALDPFTRYLELACLQKSYTMFPHVESAQSSHASDPTEDEILNAIGWTPTRRYGRDLDMEEQGGKTQRLSAEQDEEWQRREAREDVERVVRKAAAEWVVAYKGFKK
ncbi:uncharacterized protein N0V89_004015 [Didymosphaeria variabile]|uniref:Uncharacterized protein n=1 Tax=Didymosphaeria variabile TaxID=1932322 RepID=A0A9W9CCS4_9PLEO|nr:uncharacterized protein N0V89_004015 [Didymosphaeria variabile]KAJ4355990.1 hypothetical protein N0V89_004015 [Didymosphaeria variabile]